MAGLRRKLEVITEFPKPTAPQIPGLLPLPSDARSPGDNPEHIGLNEAGYDGGARDRLGVGHSGSTSVWTPRHKRM